MYWGCIHNYSHTRVAGSTTVTATGSVANGRFIDPGTSGLEMHGWRKDARANLQLFITCSMKMISEGSGASVSRSWRLCTHLVSIHGSGNQKRLTDIEEYVWVNTRLELIELGLKTCSK
jgi:hypothetical protein